MLSFGGFLGIGHDHCPLPWEKLTYDTQLDGYRIDQTKEKIEGAPSYADDDHTWYKDNGRVYDYYGVPPYWMQRRRRAVYLSRVYPLRQSALYGAWRGKATWMGAVQTGLFSLWQRGRWPSAAQRQW
ncbi:hypothetical protein FHX09_005288 [Rhizobium sp. BK538]|nr:hypothetical protein [Rhizobium sp. BK060]MBB4171396.1 hypothetical protein [Rhizobium sp. BK538]TCM68899.1 hypothetical protein EV291_12821 [Rhizobium sp. BK068]